jgi:hypothetical protein
MIAMMMMLVLLAQVIPSTTPCANGLPCPDPMESMRARNGQDAKGRAEAAEAAEAERHKEVVATRNAEVVADEIAMRNPTFVTKAWKAAFCFWGDYGRSVDRRIAEEKAIAKDVYVIDPELMYALGIARRDALKHYAVAAKAVKRKGIKSVSCTRELIEDEARLLVDDAEPTMNGILILK